MASFRGSWLRFLKNSPRSLRVLVPLVVLVASGMGAQAIVTDLSVVATLHPAHEVHTDQAALLALVQSGQADLAFETAFGGGNILFSTEFNAVDGVGANVGQGQRFTRIPRANLTGPGEWANHIPLRTTGPNASACGNCHLLPADDGAGPSAANVHRDPTHSGQIIQRNTPHLFGAGAIQRLAEEMTLTLYSTRAAATTAACRTGLPSSRALLAKGVSFGTITAIKTGSQPCTVTYDTTQVVGVSADLVVRPFQWKGSSPSLRDFNRGAAHNEIGMQPVELTGYGVDGDFDGVSDEMTIGDMTSLAVYIAAQPRPTTKVELASLGLIPPLSTEENDAIVRGGGILLQAGCTGCHFTRLRVDDPIFSEPSQQVDFRDVVFPAGQNPLSEGVDPAFAVKFDLTQDQPDNQILDDAGNVVFRLGSFRTDGGGRALVDLYGDLKRHDMGPGLAEGIDEVGTGASSFLTENLWGVGSTAPYLHDGRASTLTEAILEHGGEAQTSRDSFVALPTSSQADLIAFLNNLVLFKLPEEGE